MAGMPQRKRAEIGDAVDFAEEKKQGGEERIKQMPSANLLKIVKKVSQAKELARRKGEEEWSEAQRRAELDMLMARR